MSCGNEMNQNFQPQMHDHSTYRQATLVSFPYLLENFNSWPPIFAVSERMICTRSNSQ
eukprot:COSAG02_NODE_23778_length_708_cov_1.354680_1_plen_57_part_10